MERVTQDYCRCGHVAAEHAHGDGPCAQCRRQVTWGRTTTCPGFAWNETWEQRPA